ncbi:hypothetical protein BY996DRAFT_6485509 [Phakopsora pachyrhizi]|nr:hypothetical protein BY996DRAFT_6485509 [Phakopsora pachyrhizi]
MSQSPFPAGREDWIFHFIGEATETNKIICSFPQSYSPERQPFNHLDQESIEGWWPGTRQREEDWVSSCEELQKSSGALSKYFGITTGSSSLFQMMEVYGGCKGIYFRRTVQGVLDRIRGVGLVMMWTSSWLRKAVVEDLVNVNEGKEGQRGFQGHFTVVRRRWSNWKEEEKLDGGAHQGQSFWSRITAAKDL